MEYVIGYKYGRGTLKELSEGNVGMHDFNRFDVRGIFDMENSENKLVIAPWAVGVYQSDEHIPESYEEGEEAERAEGFNKGISGLCDFLTSVQIRSFTGKDDRVHKDLIHIVYDTNLFVNEGMVREYLGDDIGRISISPYTNFPDFNDKSPKDLIDKAEEAIYKLRILKGKKLSIEELKSVLSRLREEFVKQKVSYGLTRSEYSCFALLQLVENKSQSKRIITPSDFSPF